MVIVSAATDAAPRVELHETLMADDGSMIMSEKDGGFAVDAGGDLTLEPGGNHIMLMGVTDPLEPGATVSITLTLADGGTFTYDALVKDFTGANEEYDG